MVCSARWVYDFVYRVVIVGFIGVSNLRGPLTAIRTVPKCLLESFNTGFTSKKSACSVGKWCGKQCSGPFCGFVKCECCLALPHFGNRLANHYTEHVGKFLPLCY